MTELELKKENEALKKTIENDALTKKVKIAAMKEIERLYKMEKDLTEKIHNSIPDEKILLMLEDILTYTDLCSVCEYYGQFLPHCKCLRNSECAKHILELFKDFQERIKIES